MWQHCFFFAAVSIGVVKKIKNSLNRNHPIRTSKIGKMLFPDDEFLATTTDKTYERLITECVNQSGRFNSSDAALYSKQFAPIYAKRLGELRQLLTQKCVDKWGEYYFVYTV